MGYKTKSMINAVGSIYGGGNVDPGYDTAANLKTNLTEAGKSFGKLAGAYYSEDVRKPRLEKRAKKAESKGETAKALKLRERSKRLYGEEKEKEITPPVENANIVVKDTTPVDTESTNELKGIGVNNPATQEITPSKKGEQLAEEILESLGDSGTGGEGFKMMGDGFNKGMLRKNKYKK